MMGKEECACEVCGILFTWHWGMRDAAKRLCRDHWAEMMKYYYKHGFKVPMTSDGKEIAFQTGHVEAWLTHYWFMQEREDVRTEPSR